MGGCTRMLPLRYLMVTAGVGEGTVILQLKIACAWRCSVKFSVKEVLLSTPVNGVFKIEPVMLVGCAFLFAGCS